jgi:hypothetical protein
MNETRKFKLGSIVHMKETKVKVTIENCIYKDGQWHYYLKGFGKPVEQDLLEEIINPGK